MHAAPLVILTHVCHPAITEGFLLAAERLALPVVLLTDRRLEHLAYFSEKPTLMPSQLIECDVFNPLAVLEVLRRADIRPVAVFSNSDHLQTSTALVAAAFDLPGKDWRICDAAKNKALMRERLRERGLPSPWFHCLLPGQPLPAGLPWPVIAKPREGVASMDVQLCADAATLRAYLEHSWQQQPTRAILLESVLEGPLFTLETLSDGRLTQAVGGFDVELSAPPYFVEHAARWNGPHASAQREQALAQVLAFGIDFGVCHSEFVLTTRGPVLVEINYRSIGDGREFLLDEMFAQGWFESILRLHLGQPLRLPQPRRGHALLRYYVAESAGQLLEASAAQRIELARSHADYHPLREAGETIELSHSNKDYLGRLSVLADDETSLQQAIAAIEPALHWRLAQAPAQEAAA